MTIKNHTILYLLILSTFLIKKKKDIKVKWSKDRNTRRDKNVWTRRHLQDHRIRYYFTAQEANLPSGSSFPQEPKVGMKKWTFSVTTTLSPLNTSTSVHKAWGSINDSCSQEMFCVQYLRINSKLSWRRGMQPSKASGPYTLWGKKKKNTQTSSSKQDAQNLIAEWMQWKGLWKIKS